MTIAKYPSMDSVELLRVIAAKVLSDAAVAPVPLDVTNAQKLALTGIPTGQQVSVSDGFSVRGASGGNLLANGLYLKSGTVNAKDQWGQVGVTGDDQCFAEWEGSEWRIYNNADVFLSSSDDGIFSVTFITPYDVPECSIFISGNSIEVTILTDSSATLHLSDSEVTGAFNSPHVVLYHSDNPTATQVAAKAASLINGVRTGVTATSSGPVLTVTVAGSSGLYSVGDPGSGNVTVVQTSGTNEPYLSTFGSNATLSHPAIQQYAGTDPSDEANWTVVP